MGQCAVEPAAVSTTYQPKLNTRASSLIRELPMTKIFGGRPPNVYSQLGVGNSTQPEQQRRLARPARTERG